MSTYSSPFKAGVFSGAPTGVSFSVSGITLTAGDVGRLIAITGGDARLQHREIVAVSGNNITVSHAWDTNPFIDVTEDERASDVMPSDGDSFVISYDAAELVSSDSDMTLTGERHLVVDALRVEGGAFIQFKNLNIEWDYRNIQIFQGAGLVMGSYGYIADQDAYVRESCNITELASSSGNGLFGSSSSFGVFDMYGGNIYAPSGNPFWRGYSTEVLSRDQQVRLIGVTAYGNFGSRIAGDRGMVVDCRAVGARTTVGFSNPRSSFARFEVSALDCDQAGYVFLNSTQGGPRGRMVFPQLREIRSRLIRVATSGHSSNANDVTEVIAELEELQSVPTFAAVSGNPAGNHLFRYGNLVEPMFVNDQVLPITNKVRVSLTDATGVVVDLRDLSAGEFGSLFVRHTDIVTADGNLNLSDGVLYAPYTIRAVSYAKQFFTGVIGAGTRYAPSNIMLHDDSVTQVPRADVLALMEAGSTEDVHSMATAWLVDNLTTEEATLTTLVDGALDAGDYPITFDAAAPVVFDVVNGVITVRASVITGSVQSTGLITGKEIITGSVIDSTQDTTLAEGNGTMFSVYATELEADTLANPIVSGVANWGVLFDDVPNDGLVYVRASLDGLLSIQAVQLERGVNEFSVGLASELGRIFSGLNIVNKNVMDAAARRPARLELE